MRVLLDVSAVPDQPVGAGVYTIALAHGLAARADSVELTLLTRHDDRDRWEGLGEVVAEVPDARPARLAWEQVRAARTAVRHGIDVWHGPHYTLPLRIATPTVVTVHDLTFFDHPEWHERSKVVFFRRMIRAAATRASVCIAVSAHTARGLRALLTTVDDVVVAPHGVDLDRFSPEDPGNDKDLLRKHGVSEPYIAFAGTFEPRKDVPTLVRAFSLISEARPDLRLVLAGSPGWGARAIDAAIAGSGVATRVLRPGYIEAQTIPALFRHAEAVAYPSLEEGFGLPALEALACGAPLVSTTGSAVEEVVGDAAILVAPGDAFALSRALERALGEAERARLRRDGPERAARFTWAESVERHIETYARAAARSGARA